MAAKVVYLGGKQAGLVGLLTVASFGCSITAIVPCDNIVGDVAKRLGIPTFGTVKHTGLVPILQNTDLLISVHSKEIVPTEILDLPRLGGVNVHPCLYLYKGANPIRRFLTSDATTASVGAHHMTADVDYGDVIDEMFVEVDRRRMTTVDSVYNALYPLYSLVILEVLERLLGKHG